MQNIHPVIVHFPIALLVLAFVFELSGDLTGKDGLKTAASYNLLVGVLGAWAAVLTGLWAARSISLAGAVQEILERHELSGYLTLVFATALLVWRRRFPMGKMARVKWAFYGVLMVVLTLAGFLGGKMVYEYGIGGS